MGPSLCLPDAARLEALFAGVVVPAARHPAPAARMPPLRFPAAPVPRAAPTSPSEPPTPPITRREVPAPSGPPVVDLASLPPGPLPLAELGEVAGMEVRGLDIQGETLEARLDGLLLWLVGSTGAFAAFIADAEGLALANRHAPESYLVATAALAIAERAMSEYVPRPSEGTTVFDLDGTNVLQIIWANTSAGRLAVGLVLAEPLGRALAATARRVLQLSVERKEVSR